MVFCQRLLILISLGLVGSLLVVADDAAAKGKVAYKGATLETLGPDGRLENATLVVRADKIVAVGVDVDIPSDARVVSMVGKTILPGIIDPYFVIGPKREQPAPGNAVRRGGGGRRQAPTRRRTEGPFTRVGDYFYPFETDFKPAVRSGITTANFVLSGSGQSAFAYLDPSTNHRMIFESDGLLFAAVTNETAALDRIRSGLDPSSVTPRPDSGGRGSGGRRGGSGGRRGGRGGPGRGGIGSTRAPQMTEETREAWRSVREGEQPLILNVNNAATILHVLRLVKPYEDLRLGLVSTGANLFEVLDAIKDRNVTLILRPGLDQVPYTTDRMNVPAMIHELGIPMAFSLSVNQRQMAASQDDPLFAVAALVKTGLSREAALSALTVEPARLLGLDDTDGTLEEGKLANLLIFDGDPLETGSHLTQVIIEGDLIDAN